MSALQSGEGRASQPTTLASLLKDLVSQAVAILVSGQIPYGQRVASAPAGCTVVRDALHNGSGGNPRHVRDTLLKRRPSRRPGWPASSLCPVDEGARRGANWVIRRLEERDCAAVVLGQRTPSGAIRPRLHCDCAWSPSPPGREDKWGAEVTASSCGCSLILYGNCHLLSRCRCWPS